MGQQGCGFRARTYALGDHGLGRCQHGISQHGHSKRDRVHGFPRRDGQHDAPDSYFGLLLYTRTARDFIKWLIGKFFAPGPTRKQNENGFSLLIAEVTDGKQTVRAKLRTPEAYYLTSLTSVEIMKRILDDNYKAGFQTPSKVYGADFILEFAGVMREDL